VQLLFIQTLEIHLFGVLNPSAPADKLNFFDTGSTHLPNNSTKLVIAC
jgi:alpha-D-ribose 1-methylphosphonate 5-triphosphate synthase subunit PhnH